MLITAAEGALPAVSAEEKPGHIADGDANAVAVGRIELKLTVTGLVTKQPVEGKVTVMVAVPGLTPVTTPEEVTVALAGLPLVQFTPPTVSLKVML